jgi:hypothetical protein
MTSATPLMMKPLPTVVMNGLMRTTATRRPLARPNNSPTTIAAAKAIDGG